MSEDRRDRDRYMPVSHYPGNSHLSGEELFEQTSDHGFLASERMETSHASSAAVSQISPNSDNNASPALSDKRTSETALFQSDIASQTSVESSEELRMADSTSLSSLKSTTRDQEATIEINFGSDDTLDSTDNIQIYPTISSVKPNMSNDVAVGVTLKSRWRQYIVQALLFFTASVVVGMTIAFAFLSSSAKPITIFSKPERTILVLNLSSTLSVFLLGEMFTISCNNVRWILAARESGFGMASFLALGNSTGLLGVFSLLHSSQDVGHRIWCLQR